jgi:hypothetical protein
MRQLILGALKSRELRCEKEVIYMHSHFYIILYEIFVYVLYYMELRGVSPRNAVMMTMMHQREMSAGPTIAFPDNLICAYGHCSGVQQFKIPHIMQHKIFVYVTIFHVANPSGRVV